MRAEEVQVGWGAENPGNLRIQLGETSNQGLPMGEVDLDGPKINYEGTGEIETSGRGRLADPLTERAPGGCGLGDGDR